MPDLHHFRYEYQVRAGKYDDPPNDRYITAFFERRRDIDTMTRVVSFVHLHLHLQLLLHLIASFYDIKTVDTSDENKVFSVTLLLLHVVTGNYT